MSRYGRRYQNVDPRWIKAKYSGKCSSCGRDISAGAQCLYFPRGRSLECEDCGGKTQALIEDEKAAERMNGYGY